MNLAIRRPVVFDLRGADGLHPTGAAYALCFERLKSATRLLSVLG